MPINTFRIFIDFAGKEHNLVVRRFTYQDDSPYYEVAGKQGTRQIVKAFGKWTVRAGNPIPYDLLKLIGREIEAEEAEQRNRANKTGDFYPDVFPDET